MVRSGTQKSVGTGPAFKIFLCDRDQDCPTSLRADVHTDRGPRAAEGQVGGR